MEQLIVMFLLALLVVLTIGIIYLKDLLAAVVLLGIYSLIAAAIFLVMDAVDVAFTEAAVGAGISTIILLGTLSFTRREQKPLCEEKDSPQRKHNIYALLIVSLTGALLIYGTFDMPNYGDGNAIANSHPELAQHYIQKSGDEIGVPNMVTSVLASYRGYDTLGETAVVFTAAIGVLSLLGLRRRRRENEPKWDKKKQQRQQNENMP
jgi:multicomponent Na+:H+ antiporter subunit B